jgi:hypothetical protein
MDRPMQAGQMTGGRRKYLKWLIAVAIGIPIALEAGTFFGLLQGQTREDPGIGVGDDLLSGTDRAETVDSLGVADGQFDLTVTVENTGATPYGVTVSAVQLDTGESLTERASVGPIEPGASATLSGSWTLPEGATPTALEVVAREYADGTDSVVAAATVELDLDA